MLLLHTAGYRGVVRLTFDPPPPGGPKREDVWSTFGPNLAPKVLGFFFGIWWGGEISFLPHECILKMLRILWGIQICMQNMNFFLTPDLPHPAPQNLGAGTGPQGTNLFFKNPTYVCSWCML